MLVKRNQRRGYVKTEVEPGVVADAYNPNLWEAIRVKLSELYHDF